MKQKITATILTLAAALSLCINSSAQSFDPKFEIGLSGSGFVYAGDLSTSQFGSLKDLTGGAGIFCRYYFSGVASARLNLYRGSLQGDDAQFDDEWRRKRAYKYSSPLTELSLVMEADILGNKKFESYNDAGKHYYRWSIYGMAGFGATFLNGSRNWSELDRTWFGKDATENIPLDSLGTPDNAVFVIPVGLGVRFDVSKQVSFFAEGGYRFTLTDNMDGYKYSVYSPKFDGYTIYSFGISYRLNDNKKFGRTPIFRNRIW